MSYRNVLNALMVPCVPLSIEIGGTKKNHIQHGEPPSSPSSPIRIQPQLYCSDKDINTALQQTVSATICKCGYRPPFCACGYYIFPQS
jgi:hypothetical protein